MAPTDQDTQNLHDRIDALGEQTHKRLDSLRQELHQVNVTVSQYTTVTRRTVEQQQQTNEHLQRIANQHDERIRGLEQHRAAMDATRPRKMLDGEHIEQRLGAVESEITAIKRTLAKYAALAGGAIVLVNAVAAPALRGLWQLAFGG